MEARKQNGITLIALIVTVIILLILAGITLANIKGRNGITSKATEAAEATGIAQKIQKLQLLYVESQAVNPSKEGTIDDYLDYLETNGIKTAIREIEGVQRPLAEIDGKLFVIIENSSTDVEIKYYQDGEITEPRITKLNVLEKTENSITITVQSVRLGDTGKYTYYIKTGEEDWRQDGQDASGLHVFNGLTGEGSKYDIKVVADNGNGTHSRTISTLLHEQDAEVDNQDPTRTLNPNGGVYAKPTQGNAKISSVIVASDNVGIGSTQYAWSTSSVTEPSTWQNFTNGATITKNDITSAGTWYLWTKITDTAGNEKVEHSDAFEVRVANITVDYSDTMTNQDVEVDITYDSILSQNKKAGFGTTEEAARTNATAANSERVTATENGYVYIEAEDAAGNKVTKVEHITNINKIPPTIGTVTGSTETGNTGTVTVEGVTTSNGVEIYGYYIVKSDTEPERPTSESTWYETTNSSYTKEVTENGTYWVYVMDSTGNISEGESCQVTGIVDKVTGVTISNIIGKINERVEIVPTFTGGNEYRTISYTTADGTVATIEKEGDTYYVKGLKAGETTLTCTVTNYDGTTVSTTVDITIVNVTYPSSGEIFAIPYTNDVAGTASIEKTATIQGATSAEYAFTSSNVTEPSSWTNYAVSTGGTASYSTSQEGTYYLWSKITDSHSNSVTFVSEGITVQSGRITLTPNTNEWAKQITVTATWPSVITTDKSLTSTGTSGTDYTINGTTSVTVKTNNKTVTATGKDASGLNTSTATYTVTKVDVVAPDANTPEMVNSAYVASHAQDYYGETVVNYAPQSGYGVNAWKIYVADNDNIYLIADDYLHKNYIPYSNNYEIQSDGSYGISFDGMYRYYNGSQDLVNTFSNAIMSKWHKWANANSNSRHTNIRSAAYILDTNVWEQFVDSDYADYAIATPTLEMFAQNVGDIDTDYQSSNNGYKIKLNSEANYSNTISGVDLDSDIYSNTNSYMWLASPSSESESSLYVLKVNSTGLGDVQSANINSLYSIRPVVCLKSTIKLTKVNGEIHLVDSQEDEEDHTSPATSIPTPISITTDSLNLAVRTQDTQSGVTKIEWYYKKATDEEYTKLTEENIQATTEELEKNIVISELDEETSYNIKIIVYDALGNVTEKVSTVTTSARYIDEINSVEIPEGWDYADYTNTYDSWYAYTDSSGNIAEVNVPQLADGMVPIRYQRYPDGVSSGSESRWANAVTRDGSMWVWIPRFAYRIQPSNYHTSNAGPIEIAFLRDETNEFIDPSLAGENIVTGNVTDQTYYSGNWILAPGFTFDGEEITGFWCAKFEASNFEGFGANRNQSNNTSLTLQVKPNARSWTYINLANIATVCHELTGEYNYRRYFKNVDNVDTHLQKNVEWGAVAYLAHSTYGLNGQEICVNNNSNLITGIGSGSTSASPDSNQNDIQRQYNGYNGMLSSTTKNVYGIYDMSGGAWEYVSAYSVEFANTLGIEESYLNKYVDLYTEDESDYFNRYLSFQYGDAMYETSHRTIENQDTEQSWFYDYSNYIGEKRYLGSDYYRPVFIRGGNYQNGEAAGLFSYSYAYNIDYVDIGFRPVCIVARRIKDTTGIGLKDQMVYAGGSIELNPTIKATQNYKSISYTVEDENIAVVEQENGSYYLRGIAGGQTELTCRVINYDNTVVEKTVNVSVAEIQYDNSVTQFALSYNNSTKGKATIGVPVFISGATKSEYAFSDSNNTRPTSWSTYYSPSGGRATIYNLTEGTYYLWNKLTDSKGNSVVIVSEQAYTVVDGGAITLTPDTNAWAQQITVTANWPTVITTNKALTSTGTSGTDYTISGTTSVTVKTNNKTVTATGKDASGLNTSTATYTVTKVDATSANVNTPTIRTSSDISTNASSYYGKTIENYTCRNGEGVNAWKIFLADSDNIYLIADDYIHKDYIPDSANYSVNVITDYKVNFNGVYQDYAGSSNIVNNFSSTILSKWHKWVNANQSSTNANVKGVAYLLDKNIWKVFANETYAEYAIGGPTVEMFAASYNKLHTAKTVDYDMDTYGYKLKWSTDSSYSTVLRDIDTTNDIYISTSNSKATGAWFASPANISNSDNNMEGSYYEGRLGTASFNGNRNNGIRPIVCLKSSIKISEVGNKLYLVDSEVGEDNTAPATSMPTPINIQPDEITLAVKTKDTQSGVAKIEWYCKEIDEAQYTKISTEEIIATTSELTRNITVNGLATGVAYNIKIIVYDAAGNTTEKVSTVTTCAPLAGTIVSVPDDANWDTDAVNPTADGKGNVIPIPKGYYYVDGDEDSGFVISSVEKDNLNNIKGGNQFVWVPVPDAIYDGTTTIEGGTYTPMAKLQSGSTTDYEGMLYDFTGGTASTYKSEWNLQNTNNREPDVVSTYDGTANDTVGITKNKLQNEYNMMVKSVDQYGGFFVGRYETGKNSEEEIVVQNASNSSSSINVITPNMTGIGSWYGVYAAEKNFENSGNVRSTMIWGSQYDAMMNWMAKTEKNVGDIASNNGHNQTYVTGSSATDIINNVYDLYGCHYEWTIEAYGSEFRTMRRRKKWI